MYRSTDRYMLLQYLHFHHPWWAYTARSHGWRCCYVQDVRTDICSSATARLGLLSRSTTYIHVSVLRCSNMLHPCNDAISALPPSMVGVYRKEPWMAVLLCTGCCMEPGMALRYSLISFSASPSNETCFQPYFIKVRIFAWSFPSGLLSTSSR